MIHTKRRLLAAAIAAACAMPALAQTPSPADTQAPSIQRHVQRPGDGAKVPEGAVMAAEVVTLLGHVADIDPSSRRILLEGSDGRAAIITIGEDVQHFERLQRGDRVRARFSRAVTLSVVKDGDDIRSLTEGGSHRAPAEGDRPAGASAEYATVVAQVFAVDRAKGVVTLRGPGGQMADVEVSDASALERLREGDQVVASVVEAASVTIEPLAMLESPARPDLPASR